MQFGPERYVVLDLEMTGLSAKEDRVIEIGAARFVHGALVETYAMLINPGIPIPTRITELTGITDEMIAKEGKNPDEGISGLLDFIGEDVIVGHNISFDYSFLKQWAVNNRRPLELRACDTLKLARRLLPPDCPKKLESLCTYFKIKRERAHRALDDAVETGEILQRLDEVAKERVANGAETEAQMMTCFEPRVLNIRVKRQTPATVHQLRQLRDYRAAHNICDEINWEALTRSEASRMMDHYYSTFGR